MYPGAQGGMIIVQPSSAAVTTMQQGYQVPGQQQVYIPQQVRLRAHLIKKKRFLIGLNLNSRQMLASSVPPLLGVAR